MLDFLSIKHEEKKGLIEVRPDFKILRSRDLMIRGRTFYAVWNEEKGLWSTDEYDVQILVDRELAAYAENIKTKTMLPVHVKWMSNFSSGAWTAFKLFVSKLADNYILLDSTITFQNSVVAKKDHVSKRLEYPIEPGEKNAFDKLFGTLYDQDNLAKIMWAIGAIVSGDSKKIQKFFVLFGEPGTGKGTLLKLIENLFDGYTATFDAKSLTSANNAFSTEAFRNNPLVAINHDGDLSRISINTALNSIVSHDTITMNVKHESVYDIRLNSLLFVATNKPVVITDAMSGLIRRLVDIRPTGVVLHPDDYDELISRLPFEYPAIAAACLDVYTSMGRHYYNRYKPTDMMMRTNVVFNFVDEYQYEFTREDLVTLSRAWALYKEYCESSGIDKPLRRYEFRDELKVYWDDFVPVLRVDNQQMRSVYVGFKTEKIGSEAPEIERDAVDNWLELKPQASLLDDVWRDCKAQLEGPKGHPTKYWDDSETKLHDIDTGLIHYVIPPENHIVVDFDLKDDLGRKSLALNLEAAAKFPKTYAETSKSGEGVHLHYYYDGDVTKLSRVYDTNIEVLVPKDNFSVRRRMNMCNDRPIAKINSGLPLKVEKVIATKRIQSERSLRILILRNLHKEIHPATKPSIDFIHKIFEEANANGLEYDLSDMRPVVLAFAANSTNNPDYCIKKVMTMKFKADSLAALEINNEAPIVFFDIEVFKNMNLVRWKFAGKDKSLNGSFNPSPKDVEPLFNFRLIGFNNRQYDNHILYAIYLGYTPEQVYHLSREIIEKKNKKAKFGRAYGLSYTDVYDYSVDKQSLKKWEIELGLIHKELNHPWGEPLPEDRWQEALEYCDLDVLATEAVHNHLESDYRARLMLAKLSGLTPNDGTTTHAIRFMFGDDRNPQKQFNYPDLSETFPGYVFEKGVSTYLGEVVGEGGYVFAKPGIYYNVAYEDVTSMHPNSVINMELFGPYTKKYKDSLQLRVDIKHGDFASAKLAFGGALETILENSGDTDGLSNALKLFLNRVYGLTDAAFPNQFRDDRNVDNVVAKRGALFMVALQHALIERGTHLVHIKTDSVKIADYTEEDVAFIRDFGIKYGYTFGSEGVFEKMCLINDAVLIGKWDKSHPKHPGEWEAVGARFAEPYVFKTLFSKEPVVFKDFVCVREVKKGHIYMETPTGAMVFIGGVGGFVPVKEEYGGGKLWRVKDERRYAVSDTKGYLWLPYDMAAELPPDAIDLNYFRKKVDDACSEIAKYGDLSSFLD